MDERPSNNIMQRTALRAAADAERWAARKAGRDAFSSAGEFDDVSETLNPATMKAE